MPEWLAIRSRVRPDYIVAGINDDDCAVLRFGNQHLVITTDFLNSRPIATELGIGRLHDLGRLSVLANLADLCGSGAEPIAFLAATTMPRDASESDFKELCEGVFETTAKWNIPVIGGDTKLGTSLAVLGVAVGRAYSEKNLFLKNSALAGDQIWISGTLGSCNAAVVHLTDIKEHHAETPQLNEWARMAILHPDLPLHISREVSQRELGHGGIDISDGLGNDLHRLAQSSAVGMVIDACQIPFTDHTRLIAQRHGVAPWTFAFAAGGDMQFVVTADPRCSSEMERLGLFRIGEITESPLRVLRVNGETLPLPSHGHRDGRRMTFSEEILQLVQDVSTLGK